MTEAMEEDAQVIWENTVDDHTWECKVIRLSSYKGRLTVTHIETDKVILDTEVGLAYQAMFGPDVDDVSQWEHKCLLAIDSQEK